MAAECVCDVPRGDGDVLSGSGLCECCGQPAAFGECADRGGVDRRTCRDCRREPTWGIGSGSGSRYMVSGIAVGGGCAALVAVGYGVAFWIPSTRDVVAGSSDGSWPQTLLSVFVVIPLGTVVPEEFAFRGVLWGLLRRRSGRWAATLVSSALFGLWHVAPALAGGPANEAVSGVIGGGAIGVILRVGGTVLFTGAAGVLLCELRARSDSLLAPMFMHWAVNGLGEIFVNVA